MKRAIATFGTAAAAAVLTLGLATPSSAATLQSKALTYAKVQLGEPYVYGAEGPNAWDCSGLTWAAYKASGHPITRTAQTQFNHVQHIFYSQIKPGDLVFFGGVHSISHVGIYAGGGKIVNANTGAYRGRKVVTAPISEYSGQRHYGRV